MGRSSWRIKTNLKREDKQTIKTLSKLLGTTDTEGQISQIEVTETLLEKQIKEAEEEKQKRKNYTKLGATIGLAIVIILIKNKGDCFMSIDLLFKIAAIGILVAVLYQVLVRAGREDQAMMTTLAGLVIVLTMVIKRNKWVIWYS